MSFRRLRCSSFASSSVFGDFVRLIWSIGVNSFRLVADVLVFSSPNWIKCAMEAKTRRRTFKRRRRKNELRQLLTIVPVLLLLFVYNFSTCEFIYNFFLPPFKIGRLRNDFKNQRQKKEQNRFWSTTKWWSPSTKIHDVHSPIVIFYVWCRQTETKIHLNFFYFICDPHLLCIGSTIHPASQFESIQTENNCKTLSYLLLRDERERKRSQS